MLNPQDKTTLELQPSINSRNEEETKGRKRTEIRSRKRKRNWNCYVNSAHEQ